MLDFKDYIPCCTGMIQKEVAERLAAKPGTKAFGIITVLIQLWYDVEYLFTVPPGVFNPPPKVHSAVICMRRNGVTDPGCDVALLTRIVKQSFQQRRKMLRGSLKGLIPDGHEFGALRPEQLSVAQFVQLTNDIAIHMADTKK
jgi:16S rRNA (adenine1518-N6/adenine1519-N6)-dimethyltransferase